MNLPRPLKILNVIGALLFALAAFAQYNDIDPATYYRPSRLDAATWLGFYALIALLFVVILFKRIPYWILVVAALACLIEMTRSGPGLWINLFGEKETTLMGSSMSGTDPRVELSREFFGALIALSAVALLWWERKKYGRQKSKV